MTVRRQYPCVSLIMLALLVVAAVALSWLRRLGREPGPVSSIARPRLRW
jgi:hypothetical protein